MAMSPDKKDLGHHSSPLECFGKAIVFMKAQGCDRLGVVGASTTGMMALLASSYYPELSLRIVISPPDFWFPLCSEPGESTKRSAGKHGSTLIGG